MRAGGVSFSERVLFSAQISGKAHGTSLTMLISAFWSQKKKKKSPFSVSDGGSK